MAAVSPWPVQVRVWKTSVPLRSSSATARVAHATTSPTSSASGCRRSTRPSSSSRRSRRRLRPATCARGSVAARSASRRFGRPWPTATAAAGFQPARSYNRCTTPFLPYISVVCWRCRVSLLFNLFRVELWCCCQWTRVFLGHYLHCNSGTTAVTTFTTTIINITG